ncbi:vWA domain-containing protein [Mycolicibacterium iranicum]|uniref:vWA domain-containing protein n=1 Tax=Mycolicibacterium iranicum TaxID=912594 RepID=UPI0009EEE875|nr:vWA domain-containing protein [Mycolicibacterium iranicum]
MTNPDKTLIAALLDRSGSMQASKTATEDGWRELINEQRHQPGRCDVTLAQFDTVYELLYPPTDIGTVPEFIVAPRGMTALLDSTGRFITEVGELLSALPEDDRPGQVICMIMTDGMENSSTEWTWESVRDLISRQRDQWNWRFIFLGSNIDAVEIGTKMGVAAEDSITYDDSTYMSTVAVSAAASSWMSSARAGRPTGFSDADRAAAMGGRSET